MTLNEFTQSFARGIDCDANNWVFTYLRVAQMRRGAWTHRNPFRLATDRVFHFNEGRAKSL